MKVLDQSPLEDAFVQNPYELYAQVLADDPIRFWSDYDMVAVFDAETIQRLLRDRRLGRAAPAEMAQAEPAHLRAFNAVERHSMLDLEPPAHTRLRGLVLRAFTSRRVAALTPDIEQICDTLIAQFPAQPFDLIPAYCTLLPIRIIARLLGVPEDMAPELLRWSNTMVAMYQAGRTFETEMAANTAAQEFADFLTEYIAARREDPRDDLISHLIAAEDDGKKLSQPEMISTCILLLNAGHEATVHTLGNAVKALLQDDTPRHALAAAHIPATVEEVMRYDPPLHMFTRYAYEDVDIGTTVLKRGQQVALMLGAAGYDPRLHTDPHIFNPFRTAKPHAAFGGGLHFCVGAPLARLELQVGLKKLFAAVPSLHLADHPRYQNAYHFHGLEKLTVRP